MLEVRHRNGQEGRANAYLRFSIYLLFDLKKKRISSGSHDSVIRHVRDIVASARVLAAHLQRRVFQAFLVHEASEGASGTVPRGMSRKQRLTFLTEMWKSRTTGESRSSAKFLTSESREPRRESLAFVESR